MARPYKETTTLPWYITRDDGSELEYEVEVEYYSGESFPVTATTVTPPDAPSAEVQDIYWTGPDGKLAKVPRKDWESHGFTKEILAAIETKVNEDPPTPPEPEYEPDDREPDFSEGTIAWRVADPPPGGQQESLGDHKMKYRVDKPGHPGHDLEYVVWYELEPVARGKSDVENSNKVVITAITKASDPNTPIPETEWVKLGFDEDQMELLVDAIEDLEHRMALRGFYEAKGAGGLRTVRLKGGMEPWEAGTEVSLMYDRRNSDGSREIGLKGPGGRQVQMHLDPGEKAETYLDVMEKRAMDINELRELAGIKTTVKTTASEEPKNELLRQWRRMAVNPSKNLVETSETTGGAIVPPSFVFPDLGALLGYTQQKLPVTLLRCIDRMTPEGQNAMALMLNELQKLRPAADHLVEVFAGIVDGIDKFDAGSIEGREVARVFRYMMDAARFTQGGAELTEQL